MKSKQIHCVIFKWDTSFDYTVTKNSSSAYKKKQRPLKEMKNMIQYWEGGIFKLWIWLCSYELLYWIDHY